MQMTREEQALVCEWLVLAGPLALRMRRQSCDKGGKRVESAPVKNKKG